MPWWKSGVLYQIYPRSFADSNGDGVGDIEGIIEHLEYLDWLGIDGIWISSLMRSPNVDWGYDISDYFSIEPDFGTIQDLDRLIGAAASRNIHIVMDLVPNHTSDQHPWFIESRSSRSSPKRDWYVWADPRPDGSAPNNWVSSFGGPAWTKDETTGQYYMHNHLSEQPDLNWWNEEVRVAFDEIIGFWFDRGIAGFRIDVCNVIVKDALLRDNPIADEDDDFEIQLFGQKPVYNANRPEVHEVIGHWRQIADAYIEPKLLLGETPVAIEDLAAFYGVDPDGGERDGGAELHLAFNFPFISSVFEPLALSALVEKTQASLPTNAWPVWTGSNHDMFRFPTRWADDNPAKIKVAVLILLLLRGTPVLYQGDEIGMGNHANLNQDDMRDPLGIRYWPHYKGRDAGRTPMQWANVEGGGFCKAGVRPWLPVGDAATCNVEDQRCNQDSILTLTHDLIALRRQEQELNTGSYRTLSSPDGVWAWERGQGHVVVANMSEHSAIMPKISGIIRISTRRNRDGELISGELELAAWEAVIVSTACRAM